MNLTSKNIVSRIFLLTALAFCYSFGFGQERPKMERFLTIRPTSASFGAEGGTKNFTVSSNGTWRISSNKPSWIHLTKNGNTLKMRVDENPGSTQRSGTFELVSSGKKVVVSVKQTGTTSLSVSSDNLYFNSSGGIKTINVSANGSWNVGTGVASWGHLTRNGNTLTIKIEPNNSSSTRRDWFSIKAGNKEKRINITQAGGTEISSKSATIQSVIVENDVDVNGEKGLSVKVSFNVIGMKGKDGKVSCYFYDANGKALLDTNNSYCTNETPSHVANSSLIKPKYDNSKYTDYEVTIPYSELHLSSANTTTLRVDVIIWDSSVTPNKVLTRKHNTIFTCFPDFVCLEVDGSSSDKTKYFGESGGREYYSVSTNASSYETWGVPSWCRIENKSSSGFTLVCNRNTNRSPRSDWMKIKAAGKEIRIDIEQAAGSDSSASITSIEQFHNVSNGYVQGMNIKLKFDVRGMQGRKITATAWFYYVDNITKLKDISGNHVRVSNSDIALYENTTFTMTLFMPYQSLNMAYGWIGTLSFDVAIYDDYGNKLDRQENNIFVFSNF